MGEDGDDDTCHGGFNDGDKSGARPPRQRRGEGGDAASLSNPCVWDETDPCNNLDGVVDGVVDGGAPPPGRTFRGSTTGSVWYAAASPGSLQGRRRRRQRRMRSIIPRPVPGRMNGRLAAAPKRPRHCSVNAAAGMRPLADRYVSCAHSGASLGSHTSGATPWTQQTELNRGHALPAVDKAPVLSLVCSCFLR